MASEVSGVTSSIQPQAPAAPAQQAPADQGQQPASTTSSEAPRRSEEAARAEGLGRKVSRRI